jgi:NAD+ synthetase
MVKDYAKLFEHIVTETADYVTRNKLQAMVLGISGGIDSTVCAAICHEVSKKTGVPLIGRSLPTTFNKKEETTSADLAGNAFCDDYKEVPISKLCWTFSEVLIGYEKTAQTNLANGNIQARLRMIYLYNLASTHKGIVIDTDNLTEHNLGYWTIHGDVGDFNPIGGLWKTEVFELAQWLFDQYKDSDYTQLPKAEAMWASLQLKPTAGLGITNDDLEELGAESYEQVDAILQEILAWKSFKDSDIEFNSVEEEKLAFLDEQQMLCYPIEVIVAIAERHFKSEFKRNNLPIKISRYEI